MGIRVGLMGCGTVAAYGHLPAIAQVQELHPAAIFDPDPDRVRQLGAQFQIPGFSDLDGFFGAGLDAVTLTSPAPAHLENVLECAARRLPVLCEKPLAMDQAQGQRMIDAMKRAGVPLHTAFCYRHSPAARRIGELVAAGAIGRVGALRLIYNWDLHGKYEARDIGRGLQARREGRMREGGPMVDCGTHQIDLAQWWLGSPVVRHQAQGAWVDGYEAPDHMWLHMDHANGAHSCVEIGYAYAHTAAEPRAQFVYELLGTDGLIRYDRGARSFELRTGAGTEQLPFSPEKSFVGLYEAWARALATGQDGNLCSAETGLAVTRIARSATDQVIAARHRALPTTP